jgi:hypothetical protein
LTWFPDIKHDMLSAMDDDAPPPYVVSASPNRWLIQAVTPELSSTLLEMSFSVMADGVGYELRPLTPMTFAEAATIAGQLRDMGVAFSAGKDWSPSEVMKDLRDRVLCEGPFTEISWTGPERWNLRTQ